ncbi:hypothetical protein [Reyranella sp.]|uniref:hypothetical protein n=1 Tax=Reyranella sp. TaxID=1929291 RepID=UPI0040366F20
MMIHAAPLGHVAKLPAHVNTAKASLPASYEAAKAALANCVSIDECKDWADKAQALASYAKQANDDEMMRQSTRIRDRAIRRCGELLKQIEPQQGARSDLTSGGRPPEVTRNRAARDVGMSPHQAKQAIRVANVPAADFERQVESPRPPTVTALAEQGKKAAPRPVIDLKGRAPDEFNLALHYVGGWEQVARDLAALRHDSAVPVLTPAERARLRKAIAAIDAITDRIITRI